MAIKGVIKVTISGNMPEDVEAALGEARRNGFTPESNNCDFDPKSGLISVDGTPWLRLHKSAIVGFFSGASLFNRPPSEPE